MKAGKNDTEGDEQARPGVKGYRSSRWKNIKTDDR